MTIKTAPRAAAFSALFLVFSLIFSLTTVAASQSGGQGSEPGSQVLPTGMSITPTAARGAVLQPLNPDVPELPELTVDHPVSTAVSPDGNTLLVLTSGYNRYADPKGKPVANEYIFVYDVHRGSPVKKQVLKIPNSFVGLVWAADGHRFYASGGSSDTIHIFEEAQDGQWAEAHEAVSLGHAAGLGFRVRPMVGGLALNAGGNRLLAANYNNDSVSLLDTGSLQKIAELDLRPGKIDPGQRGAPGGEYPFWVVFKGDDKAYVSSMRDREIVVLDLRSTPKVAGRIKLQGQPNRLLLNKAQNLLFAACDNSDSVVVINTEKDRLAATIKTTAPANIFPNPGMFKGGNPNNLALSPDERTLYVTNGGSNSVAVIRLAPDPDDSRVEGLIPTGWYPSAVSPSRDGSMLYVANGKGNAGPNPKGCRNVLSGQSTCGAAQQYILQLVKGSLLTLPTPSQAELKELTRQVAGNNHFSTRQSAAPADPIFAFLRGKIKHVIYIVKENRSYDQVLGDLEKGNGDPALALFKEPIAPNHHQLARQFVTLDNFFDSGEVSGNGWNWSVSARATDYVEKTVPMEYGNRGFAYDYEGGNRNINVGLATEEQRRNFNPQQKDLEDAENQLPGTGDVAAPDGPGDETGAGYLWDSALRARLSVRNYGFYCDLTRYNPMDAPGATIPLLRDPATSGTRVAFPTNPRLMELTDPYFRSFDQRFPDYWRFKEWEREFDQHVKDGNLPSLELLRLNHDHFGDFATAIDGVNTVETMMADNDYGVGLVAEKIAHSKYGQDTLIFILEDDAQNGPDHVDAHRSIAYVIGPYVKQGAVVSKRFNTVAMIRTMEEVLGIKPLGLNDALQAPMAEVFSRAQAQWTYTARIPDALRGTQLPLAAASGEKSGVPFQPRHDAAYWARVTQGFDFSAEDKLDSTLFNEVLWKGLVGEDRPYPAERSGRDLRLNRQQLLEQFKREDRAGKAGKAETQ